MNLHLWLQWSPLWGTLWAIIDTERYKNMNLVLTFLGVLIFCFLSSSRHVPFISQTHVSKMELVVFSPHPHPLSVVQRVLHGLSRLTLTIPSPAAPTQAHPFPVLPTELPLLRCHATKCLYADNYAPSTWNALSLGLNFSPKQRFFNPPNFSQLSPSLGRLAWILGSSASFLSPIILPRICCYRPYPTTLYFIFSLLVNGETFGLCTHRT